MARSGRGGIGIQCKIGEGGTEGVPLSDVGDVVVSVAFLLRMPVLPLREDSFVSCVRLVIFASLAWGVGSGG